MPIEIKNARGRKVVEVQPMTYAGSPEDVIKYMITWCIKSNDWALFDPHDMEQFCLRMLREQFGYVIGETDKITKPNEKK